MSSLTPSLLRARAYLASVVEPPAPAVNVFIAEHGAEGAAERVQRGAVPAAVADEVQARASRISGIGVLDEAERAGMRLFVPEDPDWPVEQFSALSGAASVGVTGMAEPIALWMRVPGDMRWLAAPSASIVGARASSGYGEHVSADLAHGLARSGVTVVSGAAYGIDGAAHRGALAASGRTVAFLASGADVDYPAGHARLLRALAEKGAVLSEYPPGTPPRKHRFLVRNRLIAALGQATVVVEAGARSGATNTANTADALGRPVLAVPGPVTAATSVGCHEMVRTGKAMLATKTSDVVEVITPIGSSPLAEIVPQERETDLLDSDARCVHDTLTSTAVSADEIALDTGLALRKVRSVLPSLEMAGLAARTAEGWSKT